MSQPTKGLNYAYQLLDSRVNMSYNNKNIETKLAELVKKVLRP